MEAPAIHCMQPGAIPVMEHFYSIQGEGAHQGKAAFFIRLGGCDVGCVWCDVKESWDARKHPLKDVQSLLAEVQKTTARMVVITGGEPLMHQLDLLTTKLREAGIKTHLETSGAYPLSGHWDWICLSPKKFKAPQPDILSQTHELKIIVYHTSDFEWAEKYAALVSPECKLFLQPEWEKAPAMTPAVVAYIMDHPRWQLSLQIHKYIQVP